MPLSFVSKSASIGVCIAVILLVSGCTVKKHLQSERPLYGGAQVVVVNPDLVPKVNRVKYRLEQQVQQVQSGSVGNWLWFNLSSAKESGIKPWLRKTLGRAPAYYSNLEAERTALLMRDYLKDHGFFGSSLVHDTIRIRAHKIVDRFTLTSAGRFIMDTVRWTNDSSAIADVISSLAPKKLAREGTYYSVAALEADRIQIDNYTGQRGFFEFDKSNIFYIVDTAAGENKVNVYLNLDKGNDSLAFEKFHIGKSFIYPNFDRAYAYDSITIDTIAFDHIEILTTSDLNLHPEVIRRRLSLLTNDVYNEQRYRNTVNQLLDLGVFKYVNYELVRRATDSTPVLDQYIYLTQGQSQALSIDLEATTRSGASNLPGLSAALTYRNANVFNGAEDFEASLSGGIGPEAGIIDPSEAVTAATFGLSASVSLPRLISPFAKRIERTAFYIPRTLGEIRIQQLIRPDFNLANANLKLGYRYRANSFVTHEFYPISLSYTRTSSTSTAFENVLQSSLRLSNAFADNAVAGLEYIYTYSDQAVKGASSFWAIEGGVKSSGNLASLLVASQTPGQPKEVANVQLSQYARVFGNVRKTWLKRKTAIATRFFMGLGIPYGNSDVIPFTDQFAAGGPNSIRAFRLRELGPGASQPPNDPSSQRLDFNQTGDIRLEANIEYRKDLFGFLEGAAFSDIGNVWLFNDLGGTSPEGVFDFSTFYNQLAVGVGLGLRADFDFILVRFDVGAPIRKPWLNNREAWSTGSLNIFDAINRRENIRFHLAIGYPF